jgi:hypothetical protein|tara:strand:- start:385 stop:939 length:555 start_codon:yes stop_codon:yes gene_type:complete
MGFDLSGLNPNVTRPQPVLPPFTERTNKHWEEYYEWQEENCGTYFRNNVWWWRPLWNFVAGVCDDILTEKDVEQGSFNDGHKISKTKAGRIATRLYGMINNGQVKEYEEGYKKELASLEQVDCDICDATGKRQEPPKTGAGDKECNGCDGTGKQDDWAKSYPFSEDNVRQFANFCANSGGFAVC